MSNSPSKLLTFILWRLEVRGRLLNSELLADVKRAQFSEDEYYATIREATDQGVLAFDSKMRLVPGRLAPATNKNAEVSCETSASENELTDESAS